MCAHEDVTSKYAGRKKIFTRHWFFFIANDYKVFEKNAQYFYVTL